MSDYRRKMAKHQKVEKEEQKYQNKKLAKEKRDREKQQIKRKKHFNR